MTISVQEARAAILAHCGVAPRTRLPLARAAGAVLREALHADRDFPPYDRAMMDGYALRSGDLRGGSRLRVAGFCGAGSARMRLPDGPGACIEIGTGAVCPEGADCVIPYESTSLEGDFVVLDEEARLRPGLFLHRQGSDTRAGQRLVKECVRIGAREIAIAASVGKTELVVSESPQLGIYATGDELVDVGATPAPHQLRASNPHALAAACATSGYPAKTIGQLVDDTGAMKARLAIALEEHNVLITTGSISKGKTDFLPEVLRALGCTLHFHGVRQRPGKPMGFWSGRNGQMIFTLPGNPVSCLVGFQIYILPALHARAGLAPAQPAGRPLAETITFEPPLTWFCPVALRADGAAIPRPTANSGDFIHLLGTDGIVEFPAEASTFRAGEVFSFHPWS